MLFAPVARGDTPSPEPASDLLKRVAAVRFVVPGASGGETAPDGAVFKGDALRRFLDGEIGRPCEPSRLAEAIAGHYRALGYVPSIRASCDDGLASLDVRESSHRVAIVTFDASDLDPLGVKPQRLTDEKPFYPVPESAPRAVLRGLLQTRPGDLYNVERYRLDRIALARLGYVLLFIPAGAPPEDAVGDGAYLIQSVTPLEEEGGPHQRRGPLNYLGGTAGYGPRTGGTAGLVYQRHDVLSGLDTISVTPTFSTAWGGEIGYSAPLVAAHKEPKRIYDLGGSLFTTFINNRVIEGEERDERRTGGSISLGARPLGIPAPHNLHLEAEVRREYVDVDGLDASDLTLLRLSAVHEFRHVWRAPSLLLRTIPALELSFDAGNGAPYVRPALQFTAHGRFRTGIEYELRLGGGGIDRPVPQFQLFTLGGSTTVRGYKEDTFLGRGIAYLQSELWIPVVRPLEGRPVSPEEAADPTRVPFESRLARAIKGAVFVDGGEVWQSPGLERESISGAGVGLRLVVPGEPLVVRIDYAWGFGPHGGNAYPYIALGIGF
ncbi:MAG TPA: BamA/TamA family outer membrane protein [Candidatus Polarisedimenticolia bacterium]|nr:BamA/TamA family outer membrane protein [Candidatus Polarisedimenticolia bacterium]